MRHLSSRVASQASRCLIRSRAPRAVARHATAAIAMSGNVSESSGPYAACVQPGGSKALDRAAAAGGRRWAEMVGSGGADHCVCSTAHRTAQPQPSTCLLLLQALPGPAEVNVFIEQLNKSYEKAHVDYERNFWSTKMGLADASSEQLAATKTA